MSWGDEKIGVDLTPKHVENDTSESGVEKKNGRRDTYHSLEPRQQATVDHYVGKRDIAIEKLKEAETEIDNTFKRVGWRDKPVSHLARCHIDHLEK